MYICTRNTVIVKRFIGAISSAGSEHLVYTEGVGGSNPSSPTKKALHLKCFFLFYINSKTRSRAIPLDPLIKIKLFFSSFFFK